MTSSRCVSIACWTSVFLIALFGATCGSGPQPLVSISSDGGPDAGACGGPNEACCTNSKCDSGLSCSKQTCVSAPSCQAGPTTNTFCKDAKVPYDCGGDLCCWDNLPFYCANVNKCYETQAQAQAVCGSSCRVCNTSLPLCHFQPPYNSCSGDAGYPTMCLGPDNKAVCALSECAYSCQKQGGCYATANAAHMACGSDCEACNTPDAK